LNSVFNNNPPIFAVEAGTLDTLEANVSPEEEVIVGVNGEITWLA